MQQGKEQKISQIILAQMVKEDFDFHTLRNTFTVHLFSIDGNCHGSCDLISYLQTLNF